MSSQGRGSVLRDLESLYRLGVTRGLSDGQLLERFASGSNEIARQAFSALVERHGPMVLRVCRGVLHDASDAQDAFQATFLILLRKSRSLWTRETLGPWLFQVARRTALHARSKHARRQKHEQAAARERPEARTEASRDGLALIHQEIARLPDRFRSIIVLCDLEGLSQEDAARRLGVPVGTAKSRLSRARERLRARLLKLGYGQELGLVLLGDPGAGSAAMPAHLLAATVEVVVDQSSIKSLTGGAAATLAQGVLTSMSLHSLAKVAAVALLGLGMTSLSAVAQRRTPDGPAAPNAPAQQKPAQQKPADAVENEPGWLTLVPRTFQLRVEVQGVFVPVVLQVVRSSLDTGSRFLKLAPDGSLVKPGDLLFELDASGQRDLVTKAEINLNESRADRQKVIAALKSAELAVAEARENATVEEADFDARIRAAETAIQDDEGRLKRVEAAQKKVEGRSLDSAVEIASLLDINDRAVDARRALAQDQIELRQLKAKKSAHARFAAPRAVAELTLKAAAAQEVVRRADENVNQLQSELDRRKRAVENALVRATAEGVVVYSPGIPPMLGAVVPPGRPILQVHKPGAVKLAVQARRSVIKEVLPGMRALVETGGGLHVEGRVKALSPLNLVGDEMLYTVMIEFERLPFERLPAGLTLKAGDSTGVKIITAESENTLSVPLTAVYRGKGRNNEPWVLVRKRGGGVEIRTVELGRMSVGEVEVKKGLEVGESVLVDAEPEYPIAHQPAGMQ